MIGKSIPCFDAIAKAWDAALYPSDIPVSDPYILKTVFTPVPHAIIKQVKIDAALKIPAVVTILTAKDVPYNEYELLVNDQPVLLWKKKVRCVVQFITVEPGKSQF
ncbi:MAG: hypothetical protein GYA52_13040 [Chloroflexi bacterium]|nr:hypothetical protein [Chloroflexota bacterium]